MSDFLRYQGEEDDIFGAGGVFSEQTFEHGHQAFCLNLEVAARDCWLCSPTLYPSPSPPPTRPYYNIDSSLHYGHPSYSQVLQSPVRMGRIPETQTVAPHHVQYRQQPQQTPETPMPRTRPAQVASPLPYVEAKAHPVSGPFTFATIASLSPPDSGSRDPRHSQAGSSQFPIANPESPAQTHARDRMNYQRQQDARLRQREAMRQRNQQQQQQRQIRQAAPVTPRATPNRPAVSSVNGGGHSSNANPINVFNWAEETSSFSARLNHLPSTTPQSTTQRFPPTPAMSTIRSTDSSRSARRTREQMINSSYEHECPICLERWKKAGERDKHVRNVHGAKDQRRHKCDYCDYRGNFPREVERHVISKHPEHAPDAPVYACRYHGCAYNTSRKDRCARHEREVHREGGSQPMSQSSSSRA